MKMNLQEDFPGLNYAVITGVIKRRKGINMTRSGIPVLHLLVENTVQSSYDNSETTVSDIEVAVWGKLATRLDAKLQEGLPVLVEGVLSHRKSNDRAGGEHYKTLLKARRIEIMTKKERKV